MLINFDTLLGTIKYQLIRIIMGKRLQGNAIVRFSKDSTLKAQKGAKIFIERGVSFSRNTIVSATENANIHIGTRSGLNYNAIVVAREEIVIGANVLIGPNVAIYDHNHIFNQKIQMKNLGYRTAPIVIENNVWIGANVVILKGVTIGSGSVIAAGTVVTKDIPTNSLVRRDEKLCIEEINYK